MNTQAEPGSCEGGSMSAQEWHEGPAQYRPRKDGGVLILCPVGHYVGSVAREDWAGSIHEADAGFGRTVRCYGAMPKGSKP